jgi:Protein of unknown function (DUF2934)
MYHEDEDRIRARARHIWEREGKPDGRAEAHWEMAREEIAIEDSQSLTLLPNPAANGKEFVSDGNEAEPVTAAEEAFGDSGPAAQGEQAPYPFAPPTSKRGKVPKGR